jgi:hypothetical protein
LMHQHKTENIDKVQKGAQDRRFNPPRTRNPPIK